MTTCDCCFTGSCPEPVDVTITANNIEVTGAPAPVLSLTPISETQATLEAQVQIDGADFAGRFSVTIWFEDVDTFSGSGTLIPPTDPGAQTIELLSDADGLVSLHVANSTATRTWYAYAKVGGNVCAEPVEIALGTA